MSRIRKFRATLFLFASGGAILPSTMATAQTAPSTNNVAATGLAEQAGPASSEASDIVVTANRREERLSRVAASVAAYGQETLNETGIRRAEDLSRLTPGLTFTNPSNDAAGTSTNVSIRGISSSVGAATTGIYVDDVAIQTRSLGNQTTNAYPQIFDLDRVEVLRGPQGTLFGAGAEGGVVRFITPQPSLSQYSGNARTELSSIDGGGLNYEAGAALGGPIIDGKLGMRLSGIYRREGGYVDRVDRVTGAKVDDNANTTRTFALKGGITFAPLDTLSFTLSIMHQDLKGRGSPLFFNTLSDRSNHTFKSGDVVEQRRSDRFTLPSFSVNADLGFAQFVATTAYFDREANLTRDTTYFIPTVLFRNPYLYRTGESSYAALRDTQRNFSQEVRLQGATGRAFGWTVGGFYSHAKQTASQVNFDPFVDTLALRVAGRTIQQLTGVPLVNGVSLFDTSIGSVDEQLAAFGELTYEILPGLKLTAGARYASTKVTISRFAQGPVVGRTIDTVSRRSEDPITPRFGIAYQATPDTLLYATAAKGFRVGGGNPPVISLCNQQLAGLGINGSPETYGSDSVWSYEAGVKTRVANGAVGFSGSVFRIDWKNIQQRIALSSCGSGFVTNLGTARSEGFDASLNLKPFPRFSLDLSASYTNARLTETIAAGTSIYGAAGDKIGSSPWQVTAAAQYAVPLSDNRRAYLRADYQFLDRGPDINYSAVGVDPLVGPAQAFNQLSLRAGLELDRVQLAVFVDNALNEAPLLYQVRDSTVSPLFYQRTVRPRTIGINIGYKY